MKFNDPDDVERWLEGRPTQDAIVIAARSACRLFPLFNEVVTDDPQRSLSTLVLPCVRSLQVSVLASCNESARPSLMGLAKKVSGIAYSAASRSKLGSIPAFAAAAAVRAVSEPFESVDAAASATSISDVASFDAVSEDARRLKKGLARHEIAASPLWPNDEPSWSARAWIDLKSRLIENGDNWDIWIDWYQSRILGNKFENVLEYARANVDETYWDAGARVLNARIKYIENNFYSTEGALRENETVNRRINNALDATNFSASSDYSLNNDKYQMESKPFSEDLREFSDRLGDQKRGYLVQSLREASSNLYSDIKDGGYDIPISVYREFGRYSREIDAKESKFNPRRIIFLGKNIEFILEDSSLRSKIGNYDVSRMESFIIEHREFLAIYFSSLLMKIDNVRSASFTSDAGEGEIVEVIKAAKALMSGHEWAIMPRLPEGHFENVDSEIAEANEMVSGLVNGNVEEIRMIGAKKMAEFNASIAADLARLLTRSVQVALDHPVTRGSATLGSALSLVEQIVRRLGL